MVSNTLAVMNADSLCLTCALSDCDESDPGCLIITPQKKAYRRWYLKLSSDPVRYAEYKRKKLVIVKRYLQTKHGKAKWATNQRLYRERHPEEIKVIERRSYEKTQRKT